MAPANVSINNNSSSSPKIIQFELQSDNKASGKIRWKSISGEAMDLESEDRKTSSSLAECEESYQRNLYKRVDVFRREGLLCDVTLVVEDQKFPAHRNILAASSPYFLGLFSADMKERREEDVRMEGLSPKTVEQLLRFVYTGEVEINDENVKDLLFAGDYLLIDSLKEQGSCYLENNLGPANCLTARSFAETYGCEELLRKSKTFILENFEAVSKEEEFMGLSVEQLKSLISRDDVSVSTEEIVYEAAISWIKHNPGERRQFTAELLKHVRFGCVSKYYLAEHVEGEELIRGNLDCIKLLYEAMKSYALFNKHESAIGRARPSTEQRQEAIITVWGPGDEIRSSTQCFVPARNQWYNLAPMLIPRFSHGVAECERFIYTVGGVSLNGHLSSMERYDYRTNTWTGVAPMAREISALGVVELNGVLYTVGGWSRGRPLNTVSRYDPASNKWTTMPPMKTSRGGPCVISNKFLYAIGGKTEYDTEKEVYVYLNSVERFDPRRNSWSEVTPMQTRRAYACGIAAFGGKLCVVGGTQDDLQSAHSTCEVYDPQADQWAFIANLCIPRALAGIARVGDTIYVLGGKKSCRERTAKVECYDHKLNSWRIVGAGPNCMGGIQCCAVFMSKEMINCLPKLL